MSGSSKIDCSLSSDKILWCINVIHETKQLAQKAVDERDRARDYHDSVSGLSQTFFCGLPPQVWQVIFLEFFQKIIFCKIYKLWRSIQEV